MRERLQPRRAGRAGSPPAGGPAPPSSRLPSDAAVGALPTRAAAWPPTSNSGCVAAFNPPSFPLPPTPPPPQWPLRGRLQPAPHAGAIPREIAKVLPLSAPCKALGWLPRPAAHQLLGVAVVPAVLPFLRRLVSSVSLSLEVLPATMFVLVEMTDTVRIPPWQFERKLNESIAEELNKKLANKVKRGSCIG